MVVGKSQELCIYCEKRNSTRRGDHVPPRILFPDPKPSSLITVPCCSECNQSFQKDDEFFTLHITTNVDVRSNQAALEVQKKLLRSLGHEKATGFRRSFLDSIENIQVYSQNGIFLGYWPGYRYDDSRFGVFFDRLVRGLFFHKFQRRLNDLWGTVTYAIKFLKESSKEIIAETIKKTNINAVIIASTDFSHAGFNYSSMPPAGISVDEYASKQDKMAIDKILNLNPEGLIDTVYLNNITMCGYGPVAAMITASKILGAEKAELLKYGTSYEVHPGSSCVGYGSIVIY